VHAAHSTTHCSGAGIQLYCCCCCCCCCHCPLFPALQSRGADPSILSNADEDSYLNPGPKSVIDVAADDEGVRDCLRSLNDKYISK
jgi:hypothetical protein